MRIKDLNSSTAVHLNLLNPYFKLPTCSGSSKKQGNSRKTSTSASPTTLKPLMDREAWRVAVHGVAKSKT